MFYSIIIPTLNEEKYLPLLLDSLSMQTFKDFEVIISDGNSTDKTREVTDNFKNRLDITFISDKSRHPGIQRNNGAKVAKYSNLVFIDADVVLKPDFFYKFDLRLSKSKSLIAATVWNVPLGRNIIDHFCFYFFNVVFLSLLAKIKPVAVGTFMYVTRNSFIQVGGFDTSIEVGEDFDLFNRLGKISKARIKTFTWPRIYFSPRRLQKIGRFKFLLYMLQIGFYMYVLGRIPNNKSKHVFGDF